MVRGGLVVLYFIGCSELEKIFRKGESKERETQREREREKRHRAPGAFGKT